MLRLTKFSDLSRLRWVGATFAQMLYSAGFDTVEKVANANAEKLHKVINSFNKENESYIGHIGLNDMKILVTNAKAISPDIDYSTPTK